MQDDGLARVAYFGGSFDPPHRGHVAIARAAADALRLDRVLFAPTGRQPLKPAGATASYVDRLTMVRLSIAGEDRFLASEIDGPRADGEPNYSTETIEKLNRELPGTKLFLLLGADSFLELGRWREAARLSQLAQFIVVSRPGVVLREPPGMPTLADDTAQISRLESVFEDVSATEIRRRLAQGDSCKGLLCDEVRSYIAESGLYGFHTGARGEVWRS